MTDFITYFIIFIIGIMGLMKYESFNNDLTYVESSIDNKKHLVRNLPDKNQAADRLAKIKENLLTLIEKLNIENMSNGNVDEAINRLLKKFNHNSISETVKGSKHTSYSINKGEKIVMCLRSRDEEEKLQDTNILMFVAIHEMAHVMTKSIGHTKEFWSNFKRLLKEAVLIGIYNPIDYSSKPKQYCGMTVTDSPYFDPTIKSE